MKLNQIAGLLVCVCTLTICESISFAVEISAFMEPIRDIDLAATEMGTLAYLNVKEGDRVTKGQILAGLDESVLLAALDIAEKTRLAHGRLDSAKEDLTLQIGRLAKIVELHQRRHANAEELVRAESQKRMAEAQLQAVKEELEVKAAEHARIEAQLNQKRIKSPIDGIVTHVFKDAGEFISASDPIVIKVVQLDKLRVEFPVPAPAARDFQTDSKVLLRVGKERVEIEGQIEFIAPTTDAQSNTVRIKIQIDNTHGRFQSGDSCSLAVASAKDDIADTPPGRFTKAKLKPSPLPQ